jgi:hypothetical protein
LFSPSEFKKWKKAWELPAAKIRKAGTGVDLKVFQQDHNKQGFSFRS